MNVLSTGNVYVIVFDRGRFGGSTPSGSPFNEHTPWRQIESEDTLSVDRNLTADGPLRIAFRSWPDLRVPMVWWKKHGRTPPSASITADVQGALQTGDT